MTGGKKKQRLYGLANTAVISGQLYNNVLGELWEAFYTMINAQAAGGGFEVVTMSAPPGEGAGLLIDAVPPPPAVFPLTGKANDEILIFALFADGHPLPGDDTTLVGRGWLEGEGTNDWLVQAQVVPIPAALPLFAAALAGLGAVGWKRKAA